jgi:hypothetical protein
MNGSLYFLPEVEEDVIAGYEWYESKNSGLGDEFLHMVYAKAGEISRNPLVNSKVHHEFRRQLIRRFPYAIYYIAEEKDVIVCGIFHCARDPGQIRKILRKREF